MSENDILDKFAGDEERLDDEQQPTVAATPSETGIADELARIEEAAMHSAQTQFSSAKFWRGIHLALGIPAAMLAAAAGTTVLIEVVAARTGAVIALVAAAITAVMTTLDASQRSERSRLAANAYLALQSEARVLRTIDLFTYNDKKARERLQELVERRSAVNAATPVPSFLSYQLGRRNIVKGRQTYKVDQEG
jgi:hypothetical protein